MRHLIVFLLLFLFEFLNFKFLFVLVLFYFNSHIFIIIIFAFNYNNFCFEIGYICMLTFALSLQICFLFRLCACFYIFARFFFAVHNILVWKKISKEENTKIERSYLHNLQTKIYISKYMTNANLWFIFALFFSPSLSMFLLLVYSILIYLFSLSLSFLLCFRMTS